MGIDTTIISELRSELTAEREARVVAEQERDAERAAYAALRVELTRATESRNIKAEHLDEANCALAAERAAHAQTTRERDDRIRRLDEERRFFGTSLSKAIERAEQAEQDLAHWKDCHGVTADMLAQTTREREQVRAGAEATSREATASWKRAEQADARVRALEGALTAQLRKQWPNMEADCGKEPCGTDDYGHGRCARHYIAALSLPAREEPRR